MKKLIWGIMIVFLFCFPVSAEAQTYSFSASKVVIKTGSKKEIPVYSGKKKVKADLFKWKSSNKGIVTVSSKGIIRAKKAGSAYITASRGKKNIRCKIFVYSKTVKTGFYSYGSSVSMKTGEGITLVPKKKGSITVYKSSAPSIASVSSNGTVYAKKKGKTKITYTSYGKYKYTASVTIQVKARGTSYTYTKTNFIMHRGLLREAPENTLPSFKLAGSRGAKYLECDVRKTLDGVYVVAHDSNLMRMCGVDKRIEKITYAELKSYPIIGGMNAELYPGNYTPTLQEYINVCNQYFATPVIELKWTCKDAEVDQMNKIFLTSKRQPIVISFREKPLIKLRQINSKIGIQYIMREGITESALRDARVYGFQLSVSSAYVNQKTIDDLHKQGIKIAVWDITSEQIMRQYVGWKADYITTEEISWATKTL